MKETIITNAKIVGKDEVFQGTLVAQEGRIVSVERSRSAHAGQGAIDFEGDFLLPGLVELHTDNLERATTPRPKVLWPAVPAVLSHDTEMASAGVTTVYDAVAVGDVKRGGDRLTRLSETIDALHATQQAGMLRADHRIHLRCELAHEQLLELLTPLAGHPLVGLISLMDHTPGQRQFVTMDQFRTYYQGKYAMSDEALEAFIVEKKADQTRFAGKNRAGTIALALAAGIRLASHDDATSAHVDEAIEAGVTIAEFPTTLEAAQAARRAGMSIIGGAPNVVRGGSHSGNISALDLARADLLDVLSSDYVPASLLPAAFRLSSDLDIPLPRAVAKVSANPATAAGLHDRGALQEGLRADFVRVAMLGSHPVARATWRGGERIA